jgi:hypothetical protein
MKPTYQLFPISSSTNFLPVNVAAVTSSSPTLLHQAHATNFDEVWLRAYNYTDTDAILYLCIGGSTASQIMQITIPAGVGMIPVLNGEVFTGSISISAYASTTNTISIQGRVNRIVFI